MGAQLLPYVKAGRLFQLLAWIQLLAFVLIAASIAIPHISEYRSVEPRAFFALIFLIFPVFYFLLGRAIKQHKEWGRVAGIVLGILMLAGFPIGTILGAYILWCLGKGWNPPPAKQQ
ncbi:MAG: hypothetical protein AAB329_07630 [Pseudomonadota bacterium]